MSLVPYISRDDVQALSKTSKSLRRVFVQHLRTNIALTDEDSLLSLLKYILRPLQHIDSPSTASSGVDESRPQGRKIIEAQVCMAKSLKISHSQDSRLILIGTLETALVDRWRASRKGKILPYEVDARFAAITLMPHLQKLTMWSYAPHLCSYDLYQIFLPTWTPNLKILHLDRIEMPLFPLFSILEDLPALEYLRVYSIMWGQVASKDDMAVRFAEAMMHSRSLQHLKIGGFQSLPEVISMMFLKLSKVSEAALKSIQPTTKKLTFFRVYIEDAVMRLFMSSPASRSFHEVVVSRIQMVHKSDAATELLLREKHRLNILIGQAIEVRYRCSMLTLGMLQSLGVEIEVLWLTQLCLCCKGMDALVDAIQFGYLPKLRAIRSSPNVGFHPQLFPHFCSMWKQMRA